MVTKINAPVTAKLAGTWQLLKDSWQVYRNKIWLIILLYLTVSVTFGIAMGLGALVVFFVKGSFYLISFGLIGLVVVLVLCFISIIIQSAIYQLIKNDTVRYSFKQAWQLGYQRVWSFFAVSLWQNIMVMLWSLLLIIPGVIMFIKYSLSVWVFFYEGFEGRSALKRSKELVEGYWWAIFGRLALIFIILILILNIPEILIPKGSQILIYWTVISNIISCLSVPFIVIFTRNIYLSLVKIKGRTTTVINSKKNGLLIVLLAVGLIIIIAIFTSILLVSLSNTRIKARDARRISDVKQIQVALELYYNDNGIYPASLDLIGTKYLPKIPENPATASGSICPVMSTYTYKPTEDKNNYTLDFCLESESYAKDRGYNPGDNQIKGF